MFRIVVLMLTAIFLGNIKKNYCAEEPSCRLDVEDFVVVVEEETNFPLKASKLVASYRGQWKYRVLQTLPAQDSVCQEHVLPTGELLCVTRDGLITVRDLRTNELLRSRQFMREDREQWSIMRPITPVDNNHVAMLLEDVHNLKGKQLVLLDMHFNALQAFKWQIDSASGEIEPIAIPLRDNEHLITFKNASLVQATTKSRSIRIIQSHHSGYGDIILLPGNRLAAVRNGVIMFSFNHGALEALESHDVIGVPHYDEPLGFGGCVQSVDKLLALPDGKLAVASSFSHNNDAWLSIFDTKTCKELSRVRFEGEKKVSPVLLADGDIAVKKEKSSAEVDILYADGGRETLALGKRVVAIQGLTNGDLFLKLSDGKKTVVTQNFDKTIYLQKQRALQQKQMKTALALMSNAVGHASEDVALPEFCGS